jgi:hypothetical protein
MNGESKPFQRNCDWCGDRFSGSRASDRTCCPGCSEELYQAKLELQHVKAEFRSAKEKKEVLHERLALLQMRIDPKVAKLRSLGVLWRTALSDEERAKVEERERRVGQSLIPLNLKSHRCDKVALRAERRLKVIEDTLAVLEAIVGDICIDDL